MPPSWVQPLYVSPKGVAMCLDHYTCIALPPSLPPTHATDLESRCPKGSKTVLYYRAKQEKFAEYLNQDGLISKYTIYSDTASKQHEISFLWHPSINFPMPL